MNDLKNRLIRNPFPVVTVVALLLLGWALAGYGQTVEAAQVMTRLTARMSAVIFLFVFSASSWHRLSPGGWSAALLKNRRRLGLAFAYSHTIHLASILIFLRLAHKTPSLTTLIIGGGAYLVMYAMALTSNDRSVRRLGARKWKRLHQFGLTYLWLVFFLTYLSLFLTSLRGADAASKANGGTVEFIAGLILMLTVMVIRAVAALRTKRAAVLLGKNSPSAAEAQS